MKDFLLTLLHLAPFTIGGARLEVALGIEMSGTVGLFPAAAVSSDSARSAGGAATDQSNARVSEWL
jgi:prevent-host-death family protein